MGGRETETGAERETDRGRETGRDRDRSRGRETGTETGAETEAESVTVRTEKGIQREPVTDISRQRDSQK